MLHDPISIEDAEPFITLPRLRPLPNSDHLADTARGNGTAPDTRLPALEGALREIAELRREQIVKWGHTPEKDRAAPLCHLPMEAKSLLAGVVDDIQFHPSGPAFAEVRPRIRKRLLKAGAFIAAALDRLDAEPDDSADWPSL